ncbi:2-amino-4-hydroxy-6-hydroxymethyldihydropteridine diphosphokinase [Saccharospirillum sp. MSK14-1]|uniref:2-amino-4-hydroxy-6- hydroxymethyldihydropteridine diphosphokinase n=1 Tax=Saccharospirillum sp. MSK14-1 TaxID=1897632 RepID=UPI001E2DFD61|nr:2-amino-4-hydroxy-6-hydroxymethyldihydropteridine diphosphokinase [Saccharospirillum sp. MSK14-1]
MSNAAGVDVALSLGSNIDRYRHITGALDALADAFGDLVCSPVYESESVGFDGSPFLNSVVLIRTDRALVDIVRLLKRIEDDHGRNRSGPKFSPRTLDIDVLTYGEVVGERDGIELPRAETAENAFVLKPMADILPDARLPGSEKSYAELWADYPKDRQKLWPVPFQWRDQAL